ncbi:MAG: chorismate synthase, partial [Eubacterium sp.]|nr:chorismate synthase [Eubacterium sp.]
MSGSSFGKNFTVTTWGESHGKAIGAVVDGCPSGLPLDEEAIQVYLDRRKPGKDPFSTPRKESDKVEILSGVFEGRTTGTPISLIIPNSDQHSSDYSAIKDVYRPGHA